MTARVLSLLSAIALTFVFFCSARAGSKWFLLMNTSLQTAGYLLLAGSSWIQQERTAALVLVMCAINLINKVFVSRKYAARMLLICCLATLAGGLIVNNRGWAGMVPFLAGFIVISADASRSEERLPLRFFPKRKRLSEKRNPLWDENEAEPTYRIGMANANFRITHIIPLFVENILGVGLWILYAYMINDKPQLIWRSGMLALNLCGFAMRFCKNVLRPIIRGALDGKLPRKRLYLSDRYKIDWYL